MDNRNTSSQNARKLAKWAQWGAFVGLVAFTGYLIWLTFSGLFNSEALDQEITRNFLEGERGLQLSAGSRIIGYVLTLLPDLPGIYGLYIVMTLFSHIRKSDIISEFTADSLQKIGWSVVWLMPFSKIAQMVGYTYFSRVANPTTWSVEILIESSDFYALVFGLVIVLVGHIMLDAVKISDENRSFV